MINAELRHLASAKDLVRAWTGRTVRGRYQQSLLGWLWAVVQPAAAAAIFTIIFTRFVPVDTGEIPYPLFSYVAMVPWAFTGAALTDMSTAIVQNMALVTKISFPRVALPAAAMTARLLDLAVSAILIVVLMLIYRIDVYPIGYLFLPLILAIQIALVLGLGLLVAAGNVFFRDVQPLLTLGIQLWFYASPIIYPAALAEKYVGFWYYLNPMAGILEAYRDVLLEGQLPGSYLTISGLVAALLLVLGYAFFRRVEYLFADVI
jgi:lipopolysaccharide transport system permease protein